MVRRPHDNRMSDLARRTTPRRQFQDPIVSALVQRDMQMDIGFRAHIKELTSKVRLLAYATMKSSSGLRIALELRRFWLEYFDRFGRLGPASLPSSFNVVEAFVRFDPQLLVFELLPEREHLLSFGHYLDWYTSGAFPEEPGALTDVMQEGLIYSYDFVLTPDQPLLSTPAAKLCIASVALVRHQDELSILVLAGETPPREASMQHGGDPGVGKEEVQPLASITPDERLLEGAPAFSRVILASRFNLSNRSNDVRYILVDTGNAYDVITDDFDTIKRSFFKTRHDPRYLEVCELQKLGLANYSDLFSAAASLIYLPALFIAEATSCRDTEFLTHLGLEGKDPKAKRLRKELGDNYFIPRRVVRCLPAPPQVGSTVVSVHPPELTFDSQGYWKPLAAGEIGRAADGTAIVGKTWVTRTDTWDSTSPAAFLASRVVPQTPTSEYVYVTRSPSHAADIYKVGMTTRDVAHRVTELSRSTAAPLPFEVLASWAVPNAVEAERRVHAALAQYRLSPRREFFRAALPEIIRAIDQVLAEPKS
jgi:hypothetical protein